MSKIAERFKNARISIAGTSLALLSSIPFSFGVIHVFYVLGLSHIVASFATIGFLLFAAFATVALIDYFILLYPPKTITPYLWITSFFSVLGGYFLVAVEINDYLIKVFENDGNRLAYVVFMVSSILTIAFGVITVVIAVKLRFGGRKDANEVVKNRKRTIALTVWFVLLAIAFMFFIGSILSLAQIEGILKIEERFTPIDSSQL